MNRSLRIVVADDERDMREFLQEVLPRLGHQIVGAAETGRQVMAQVKAARPDLIIADIKMPDLDGIETAKAVNQDKPVPVILVSAHHDAETLARLGEDYIMGYLVKPVKEPDLKAAITVAMNRFQHFLAVAQEAATLRQALEDRKLIERSKGAVMKRLRVDEEDAFRRLRRMASDQNRKLVDIAQQVVAAEEVFRLLDKN